MNVYLISADGGKTFTRQWLTKQEAAREEKEYGHIVQLVKHATPDSTQFFQDMWNAHEEEVAEAQLYGSYEEELDDEGN